MLAAMVILKSRLGDWELPQAHAWADRDILIRAPTDLLIEPTTKVATIGSCFASELAAMMGTVGIIGGMHPGGLFYSTATIRQELERIAGGWPERASEPLWAVPGGFVDPYRDYSTTHPDEATLLAERAAADRAADDLFRDARVVVATLGLIETFRSPVTGDTYRQIPHPAVYPTLGAVFHRLTVDDMLSDLERIRTVVQDTLGATLILTTSPVPLHTTFTAHDVRVANMESKSRIRAAVSEFTERHPEVRYFHSYEMVVTAERQSDYFRADGRHVHRHAVRYIVSEFVRLFAADSLQLQDVDAAWITPIEARQTTPAQDAQAAKAASATAAKPRASLPRRVARRVRRTMRSLLGRS
jgi:ADP-ribose pyrophosphatase YjhB (NUDIX family)